MSGQQCSGHAVKNGDPRESRAYCDGMAYRQSDFGDQVPDTDNPHQTGSDAAIAWQAGWDAADAKVGDTLTKDEMGCCSIPPDVPAATQP